MGTSLPVMSCLKALPGKNWANCPTVCSILLLVYVDRILAVHSDLLHAEPKQMNMLIHEFNNILQVKGKTEKDKNAQTDSLMKTRI